MTEKLGATLEDVSTVRFRVWAPKAQHLSLVHNGHKTSMTREKDGYYSCVLNDAQLPLDYFYEIDGEKQRPDPCSRWQPQGVHKASRIYDYRQFPWQDSAWKGIPLQEYIIYELHVGTFTPNGTFESAIEKLPYLKELGITAVELMPVVEFPGPRNWGYDLAYQYAVNHGYGGPDSLKKFINAAHLEGLAVVIDVVYNHLGPEGNYLGEYGPYFTDHYKTPWGQAINYDGPESDQVRKFFISNALYWLEEFHADALRLDAVHAIYDFGAKHFLKSLAEAFHAKARELGKQAFLIAESDLNDVRVINDPLLGGYGIDSQWNDDLHHALHALMTGSTWRYFGDFGAVDDLFKALSEGFVYDWKYSNFRKKHFGSDSKHLSGDKFVVCSQNHDQIANACMGKRLGTLVGADRQMLAAAIVLLSNNIPMLFMGEEWNASSPFYFFTSFDDKQLGEAVRNGYRKEFELKEENDFDPQDPKRFEDSKLKWEEIGRAEHARVLEFYKQLIALRKKYPKVMLETEDGAIVIKREDREGNAIFLKSYFSEHVKSFEISTS